MTKSELLQHDAIYVNRIKIFADGSKHDGVGFVMVIECIVKL